MPAAKDSPSPPYSILLVDDNPHGLAARRRILSEVGYEVRTALSAEEALELIEKDQQFFHIVVTDFRMIAMDGIELIARLKICSPGTKTVLLSGFVEPLGLTEESTGANAVIAKCAAEVGQLTRTVQSLLTVRAPRKPASSQKNAPASSMVKSV
ncbi:MAG: response regulator receiver protein [Bryobacterales bacterium]|nr:response regulator receiver protein [Bryobacterales bacterium]